VVVPLLKGSQCPPELLVDAATLAVHHSDARGADFAEVTWAERRYVRKPKGSPAGRVVVDREKVLALGAEPGAAAAAAGGPGRGVTGEGARQKR
jgi:predicted ribosome quality control (RQC) complex YloA/Tae2 family protein